MNQEDALHCTVASDRHIIDNRVDRIFQELEAGDEGNIETSGRELPAKRARVIKLDRPIPAEDQRSRVEVFDAADAQRRHAQASSGSRAAAPCGFTWR